MRAIEDVDGGSEGVAAHLASVAVILPSAGLNAPDIAHAVRGQECRQLTHLLGLATPLQRSAH